MAIGIHRPTKITLDTDALVHNINVAKAPFADDINVFAVVKANAYGHGVREITQMAKQAGVTGFAVAILDEALEVRELGYEKEPVLVLGITSIEYIVDAAINGISLTVGDLDWLKAAQPILDSEDIPPLKVHLAVDTGMGRIGAQNPVDLSEMVKFLRNHPREFNFEGMFTHFATADAVDEAYFDSQVANWEEAISVVNPLPKYVHAANSAATIWHPKAMQTNVLRLGAGMYGFNPSGTDLSAPMLKPVLSLTTEMVFVKQLAKGKSVSYGATYQATENEWIATLPIGYADGFLRRMQGYHVLVDGQKAEIVGRVTMDQMMIRLPKKYAVGTEVTIVGENGGQNLSLVELATYANTIPYEIVTNLSTRIKREVK
ncbi:alanine racemase [Periweissella fabaria]|uniref:Alanine racemase n=1 Tax=Periweissella fabaria TaxID=546157 RepID=A0ABM8Z6C0_9LACO|nr:alanine racemase [Periweissella fabaria]MCM0597553.1 alanine racemase [Periweissella fabaria]CAH0416736.1 Alanine racemase [Periweissella fabaria]